MKKGLKQILLMFLVLAIVVVPSVLLFSCGNNASTETTTTNKLVLPGDTSTTGTQDTTTTVPDVTTLPPTTTGTTPPPANTTTEPVVEPPVPGQYINPLTGLPSSRNAALYRPVAIVVDNISNSYAHQSGLNQADILYEALVAPGITRFLMIVSDYTNLSAICNVRSARIYHIDLAANHNAILVAHNGETWNNFVSVAASRLGGGWNATLGKNTFGYINTKEEYAFGTKEGGEKYGTIKYYTASYSGRPDLQYDTLVTSAALNATLQSSSSRFALAGGKAAGTTPAFAQFVASKTMSDAFGATRVNLSFTLDNYPGAKNVYYVYNSATGKYLRYQDQANKAHVDAVTGVQLSCTNLITLFTDVTNNDSGLREDPNVASMTTVGSGTGYYFYGGKCVAIRWSKSSWNAELKLTLTDGTPLTLAAGNTHIAYLDNTNIASAVSFN